MTFRILLVIISLALAAGVPARAEKETAPLGAWQNPDIGLVYDLKMDWHNADRDADGSRRWTTRGFDLATAELSVGAEADPFGRIDFNAMFFEEGAEIHELFFTMPALPLGLKAQGGQFLASFGRWSRFHAHAMPFASEPRILGEYLGGHLLPQGLELSWLAPTDHYLEVRGGMFNGIEGHSHDSDPAGPGDAFGPGNPPPGCHYHDGELHCPDDPGAEEYYRSLLDDPEAPVAPGPNRGLEDLAWLGRVQSSLEMGDAWSVDLGASVIHQDNHRSSLRFEGWDYAKTVAGFDVTFFWSPPEQNLYRGLDFGVEYLHNREQFEVQHEEEPEAAGVAGIAALAEDHEGEWLRETLTRDGFFTWARYRASRRWEFGSYLESFAARNGPDGDRTRIGGFLTFNVSHYQKLRLEYVHDDRGDFAEGVDQVILQFDGLIGYHTHGRQR
ncbi:MAG: hypothetical protein ABIK96_01540 [bacterium]